MDKMDIYCISDVLVGFFEEFLTWLTSGFADEFWYR